MDDNAAFWKWYLEHDPRVILSLGAGVQSSVLALMFSQGEFEGVLPMPEVAVFSDTQAEPAYVYEWISWLRPQLAFPIEVVTKGSLRKNILDAVEGERFAGAPFFTESDTGREGRLRRQCTREFKVEPITKFVRGFVGLEKGQRAPRGRVLAMQYIGISMDEAIRMKPAREKWVRHFWPLIDKRMSRYDCLQWMEDRGLPLPRKSSCTFCPYHDDAYWREMKETDPQSWQDAIEVDRKIRAGVRGTEQKLYLHRSLKPLEEVDLSFAVVSDARRTPEDYGQENLFGEECEGMCGV